MVATEHKPTYCMELFGLGLFFYAYFQDPEEQDRMEDSGPMVDSLSVWAGLTGRSLPENRPINCLENG